MILRLLLGRWVMLVLLAAVSVLYRGGTAQAAEAPASGCEVLVIARIVKIVPQDADATVLKRGSAKPVRAAVDQCLGPGEKVTVRNGTVTLQTPSGRRLIGRYQESSEYATADLAVTEVPSGPLAAIQTAIDRLMSSARRSEPGGARGDGGCTQDDPKVPPVIAVPGLPAGAQRVGADVEALQLGWDATGGAHAVRIVVRDSHGKVIAERMACEAARYRFDLDPSLRKPGTQLLIEAGTALAWRVQIVDPAQLPQPSEPLPASWLLGAWRLDSGPPDTRLDALSRLATAEKDFLGANLLLGAALAPK